MLTIETINPVDKLFIDPYQFDLDSKGRALCPVENVDSIELAGDDVLTFLAWASVCWREDFEADLQALCEDKDGRPLLTTTIPLVIFREELCTGVDELDDHAKELIERLRELTYDWRDSGVDTLCISGYDLRHRIPKPAIDTAAQTERPTQSRTGYALFGGGLSIVSLALVMFYVGGKWEAAEPMFVLTVGVLTCLYATDAIKAAKAAASKNKRQLDVFEIE